MYIFSDADRRAYEALPIALVFDQYIDGKVVPLLVSDGFCQLVDMPREKAMTWFASGQFERIHSEDVGLLVNISEAFISHSSDYDVVFRARHRDGFHSIHAVGKWLIMPDGTELAVLVYHDMNKSRESMEGIIERYQIFRQDTFYTDPLTGLPNVNYLHKFANERIHSLRVDGKTPVLLYSDINSMQFYNNQYGFKEGDNLLKLVCESLKEKFPAGLIVRGADDHFIVIAAFNGEKDIADRIQAVNHKIKNEAFGTTTGIQAGVYVYEDETKTSEALDHAKNALKRIGTDLNETFRFYSQEADDLYWEQRYIVENFEQAMEAGWIKVYYQPIERLATGKIAALEGLARWVDPLRGIIPPNKFIPVLEKYHLLYKLDLYMVEQVCREISLRQEMGLQLVPISVNFAAQDFDYVDIPQELDALNERYGIAHYLEKEFCVIEITEQDMATATERFLNQLKELHQRGYRLWLDDFGSGYSSLNVFSRFDIDLIKFDLDFLRHLDDHNGVNRKIIRAMVDIAHEMGIRTLVEGMETEEHRAFLGDVHCDLAQGYLFGKPEPLEITKYRSEKGIKIRECETADERIHYSKK